MAKGHTITTTPAIVARRRHPRRREDRRNRPAGAAGRDGLPTRYYLPREDVRTDLLRPTDLHTTCPFKGEASYWSAEVGGEVYNDLVWSYETPIPQAAQIAGLMCFYPDRVELTVDGQPARPPRAGFPRPRSLRGRRTSPAVRYARRPPVSSAPGARRGAGQPGRRHQPVVHGQRLRAVQRPRLVHGAGEELAPGQHAEQHPPGGQEMVPVPSSAGWYGAPTRTRTWLVAAARARQAALAE